jgi:Holliday junction resolvase RusA-like endonuclease
MMEPIRIVILGSVAPYQKAVSTWHARDGRSGTLAYDKKSYRDWRSYARGVAAEQMAERPVLEGAVEISVAIFKQIPASFSAKKRQLALRGILRPITKPDCSNQLKAIEDAALTGIVIRDDRCIVGVRMAKWFSDKPRVEIEVKPPVLPAAPGPLPLFGDSA